MRKSIKLLIDNNQCTIFPNVARYIKENKRILCNLPSVFSNFDKGVEVCNYISENWHDTSFKPIKIKYSSSGFSKNEQFTFHIYSKVINYYKKIKTTSRNILLYNLIPFVEYYYFVSSDDGVRSAESSFVIQDEYRFIYTKNGFNIRDIGGKMTTSGKRIKYGLMFRGLELTTHKYISKNDRKDHGDLHIQVIHKVDLPYLYDLGIKVDLDLRGDQEAGYRNYSPLKLLEYYRIPIHGYQTFFKMGQEDEIVRKKYRRIFSILANADKKPVYVHCWGGADRTGTISFLLEALLGVSMPDLVIDYELTTFVNNMCRAKAYDDKKDPGYRAAWNYLLMIEWLKEFAKDGESIQDTVTRYLLDVIKISPKVINKIKKIYLM